MQANWFDGVWQFLQSIWQIFRYGSSIGSTLGELLAPFSSWTAVHYFGALIWGLCIVAVVLIVINIVRDVF